MPFKHLLNVQTTESFDIHMPFGDAFEYLLKNHPDQNLVKYIINGLRNGFNIGFTGEFSATRPKNLKSADQDKILMQHDRTVVVIFNTRSPRTSKTIKGTTTQRYTPVSQLSV